MCTPECWWFRTDGCRRKGSQRYGYYCWERKTWALGLPYRLQEGGEQAVLRLQECSLCSMDTAREAQSQFRHSPRRINPYLQRLFLSRCTTAARVLSLKQPNCGNYLKCGWKRTLYRSCCAEAPFPLLFFPHTANSFAHSMPTSCTQRCCLPKEQDFRMHLTAASPLELLLKHMAGLRPGERASRKQRCHKCCLRKPQNKVRWEYSGRRWRWERNYSRGALCQSP